MRSVSQRVDQELVTQVLCEAMEHLAKLQSLTEVVTTRSERVSLNQAIAELRRLIAPNLN